MEFLRKAARFLDKNSGKICLGLTAIAVTMRTGIFIGSLFVSVPFVAGFVALGFLGAGVVFGGYHAVKLYGDYREQEANLAREEEMKRKRIRRI